MYHITHILNFQLSILLGSLSPFTLNFNQIVFFFSYIPRTKDLSFSRISNENTRGEILNWITMNIFVLWNLFRRKKKTLWDTVRIITEKKSERYHTRTLHLQHAYRRFSGCGGRIYIDLRTLYTPLSSVMNKAIFPWMMNDEPSSPPLYLGPIQSSKR